MGFPGFSPTQGEAAQNALTTAMQSNASTQFVQANAGFNGTSCSGTIASNSMSISIGAYITTGALSNITASFGTMSYWQNTPFLNTSAITQTSGSSIWVQPFSLPQAASFSYVRMLASYNDSAVGTAGTTQNATSFSCTIQTTFGLVIYSQGAGASSRSLMSMISTSGGLTGATIYTAGANGSQYTVTLQKTYPDLGASNSQYTTSYAVSSASIVISSNSNTLFTGVHYLDIAWATSLSAGNYWLGLGASSASGSQSSNISFCGTALMPMSIQGMSLVALSGGRLGQATSASDQQINLGLGMWSTNASGFTQAALGLNSISQVVSNPIIPFQLIRQA